MSSRCEHFTNSRSFHSSASHTLHWPHVRRRWRYRSGLDPHTALNAAAHLLAIKPGHRLLVEEVFHALMDMAEAVDFLPGEMRFGHAHIPEFRIKGKVVRGGHDVDAPHEPGIKAIDDLAPHVDVVFQLRDSLLVLFTLYQFILLFPMLP